MGGTVGHNISLWKHVRLFSPWNLNISEEGKRAANEIDSSFLAFFEASKSQFPTGGEYISKYLVPLSQYLQKNGVQFHFQQKVN